MEELNKDWMAAEIVCAKKYREIKNIILNDKDASIEKIKEIILR